jgi:tetratricopeptide (TPR) repeat protein
MEDAVDAGSPVFYRLAMPEGPDSSAALEAPVKAPGPWPAYALLPLGLAVSGLLPWLMVSWALYRRGLRRPAVAALAANLALSVPLGWASMVAPLPWWWMSSLALAVNLVWAAGAWLVQRRYLGPSVRRYHLREWRSWIGRLGVGATLGACAGIMLSIPKALAGRVPMQGSLDALDRQSVLWDCFSYLPVGLLAGLAVGLWWAGTGRRFRASHVLTLVCALAVTSIGFGLLSVLLLFLLHRGASPMEMLTATQASLVPPWTGGFRGLLFRHGDLDLLTYVAVALLFGAPSRIRDFALRTLLVPLAFVCSSPGWFASTGMWTVLQPQLLYDADSGNAHTRERAQLRLQTLLQRYPDHSLWPAIAEDLARYRYQHGDAEAARHLYQELEGWKGAANQWHWIALRARGALASPGFGGPSGNPSPGARLEIPMVDYEAYLTQNWMALLSVVRYWEGEKTAESEVKIRLKELSRSDDEILLSPLTGLADLDDAARSLGFEVLLLPAEKDALTRLLSAGFPVIHPDHGSFAVVFGHDPGRAVFRAYCFAHLSNRLKVASRREAEQILTLREDEEGRERLARIANEAYREYAVASWEGDGLVYRGPLMAVVCPEDQAASAASALGADLGELRLASRARLAALIGLAFVRQADPVAGLEWARLAAARDEPLALQVGYLAGRLWESRLSRIRSRIPLDGQFPELARIGAVFDRPDTRRFLEQARQRFEEDLGEGRLAWYVDEVYLSMLDRSDPRDLERLTQVMRARVSADPARHDHWKALAGTYEWKGDLAPMVEALAGAVSASPEDFQGKLRLAYGHVLLGEPEEAQRVLREIDPEKVETDADYPFCLGAVAEAEGDESTALREYGRAIELRSYRPVYHLRYGRLLAQQGRVREARRALAWAARIDADGPVREEAQRRLAGLGSE